MKEIAFPGKRARVVGRRLWLAAAAGGSVYVTVSEAGIGGRELHVDRRQLRRLAGTAERRLPAKPFAIPRWSIEDSFH